MNCTCVTDIESKIVSGQKFKDKPITKAKIQREFRFNDSGITMVTSSTLFLTVEGMVREQKIVFVHSFCPFCGVKIEKEENLQPAGQEGQAGTLRG